MPEMRQTRRLLRVRVLPGTFLVEPTVGRNLSLLALALDLWGRRSVRLGAGADGTLLNPEKEEDEEEDVAAPGEDARDDAEGVVIPPGIRLEEEGTGMRERVGR